MSSLSASIPTNIPAFAIPIINEYAKQIKPPVAFLMVGTVFATMLVPLLLSLFYFSTKEQRCRPIFILVVFDVLLGIALGVWNGFIMAHSILSPLDTSIVTKIIPFITLFILAPWLIDIVLVVRLLSVFPPLRTPRIKFAAIFAFPALIKVARLTLVILLIMQIKHNARAIPQNNIAVGQRLSWAHSVYSKAEWICQIMDNAYVSAFFIWKLRDKALTNTTACASNSIARRLQALFWIAATNFIFPILFNIAQIVVFYHDLYFTSAIVTYTSVYLSILGVVFATVWASELSSGHPARSGRNNLISTGSAPARSGDIYTFKSALSPDAPSSVSEGSSSARGTTSGQGYSGYTAWEGEQGVGTNIPLDIKIARA